MREVFIKGFNEKYSINENGEVWSNYRFNQRFTRKIFEKKRLYGSTTNTSVYPSVTLVRRKEKICKLIKLLMIECFELKKPDSFHWYCLINKDGNAFNNALNNLEWRARQNATKEEEFHPQRFYNNSGQLADKICCRCGEKQSIKLFKFFKSKSLKTSYSNICISCTSEESWIKKLKDPTKILLYIQKKNRPKLTPADELAYRRSPEYKNTERHKRELLDKKRRVQELRPSYIKDRIKVLGLTKDNVSDDLIQFVTEMISLYRRVKQAKLKSK